MLCRLRMALTQQTDQMARRQADGLHEIGRLVDAPLLRIAPQPLDIGRSQACSPMGLCIARPPGITASEVPSWRAPRRRIRSTGQRQSKGGPISGHTLHSHLTSGCGIILQRPLHIGPETGKPKAASLPTGEYFLRRAWHAGRNAPTSDAHSPTHGPRFARCAPPLLHRAYFTIGRFPVGGFRDLFSRHHSWLTFPLTSRRPFPTLRPR
jgi:hypothetical protein